MADCYLIPELARAILAVSLVALAYFWWGSDRSTFTADREPDKSGEPDGQ